MAKKHRLYISVFILIIVAALGFVFWRHHEHDVTVHKQTLQTHVKQVDIKPLSSTKSSAASTPEPAKTPSGTGELQQSESTDTNGQATAATPKSDWVTSDSGNITLEQPAADTTISSGAVLVGTAKTTTVDYRLSDDSVGVLTEGTLNVVNGKFSGTLYFTPKSTSGQLDVFTTNSRGIELNEIQIGVKF